MDNPATCFEELVSCNRELAKLGPTWSNAAGNFKALVQEVKTEEARARRDLRVAHPEYWRKPRAGDDEYTTDDRNAEVRGIVEGLLDENGKPKNLYLRLALAEGTVEECLATFKSLDRRASNAQSILSSIRAEGGLADYVYPDPDAQT